MLALVMLGLARAIEIELLGRGDGTMLMPETVQLSIREAMVPATVPSWTGRLVRVVFAGMVKDAV